MVDGQENNVISVENEFAKPKFNQDRIAPEFISKWITIENYCELVP